LWVVLELLRGGDTLGGRRSFTGNRRKKRGEGGYWTFIASIKGKIRADEGFRETGPKRTRDVLRERRGKGGEKIRTCFLPGGKNSFTKSWSKKGGGRKKKAGDSGRPRRGRTGGGKGKNVPTHPPPPPPTPPPPPPPQKKKQPPQKKTPNPKQKKKNHPPPPPPPKKKKKHPPPPQVIKEALRGELLFGKGTGGGRKPFVSGKRGLCSHLREGGRTLTGEKRP